MSKSDIYSDPEFANWTPDLGPSPMVSAVDLQRDLQFIEAAQNEYIRNMQQRTADPLRDRKDDWMKGKSSEVSNDESQ